MAGERTLPGLGLRAYWTPGSNGFNAQLDPDLRKLSVLCQLSVLSRVTALPGSPANGDIYIVPSGAGANANEIALRDNGAWVYITPLEGWLAWVKDTDEFVKWTGSAWTAVLPALIETIDIVTQTAAYTFVLSDRNKYLRMNVASAHNLTVPPNSSVAFAVGTQLHVRQVGAGQTTIQGGVGVTINTPETTKLRKAGATVSLLKVATNEWDLTGDLEPLP